jgi:hypothetical protein
MAKCSILVQLASSYIAEAEMANAGEPRRAASGGFAQNLGNGSRLGISIVTMPRRP